MYKQHIDLKIYLHKGGYIYIKNAPARVHSSSHNGPWINHG